jgi:hypothetical protein
MARSTISSSASTSNEEAKYPHTTEDTIVPQLIGPSATDSLPEAQRTAIRLALEDIASEIGIKLSEARLSFPIFLTVPIPDRR